MIVIMMHLSVQSGLVFWGLARVSPSPEPGDTLIDLIDDVPLHSQTPDEIPCGHAEDHTEDSLAMPAQQAADRQANEAGDELVGAHVEAPPLDQSPADRAQDRPDASAQERVVDPAVAPDVVAEERPGEQTEKRSEDRQSFH